MVTRAARLLIVVVATAAAQQDTPTPTFRSGTKLVEVYVAARSHGAPATGLTKDDFTLLDNGKPQKIAFFSVQSGSVPATAAAGIAPPPPAVVSNRSERGGGQPAGNTTVLLLDQRNTPQPDQARAIQHIAKFLAARKQALGQRRTGIYTFVKSGSIKVVQEITDDDDLLSRAAGSLKAQAPDFRSPDVSGLEDRPIARGRGGPAASEPLQGQSHVAGEFTELLIRLREIDTRQMLETVAQHLANVPGRKSLIWISSAFPLFWRDINFTADMQEAARKLNDAGVTLYAVDPRGVAGALAGQTNIAPAEIGGVHTQEQIARLMINDGNFPPPRGRDTMGLLAAMTGGLVFADDNGIAELIQAAAHDGEFTYSLGFYPAQEDRSAARHRLNVLVSKPGIALRYRQNYLTPVANDPPTLQHLLNDAFDSVELEVVASASPDDSNPGSWRVKVNVNLHDLELKNEDSMHSGEIDVSFHAEGAAKVVTKTLRITVPEDQFAAFLEKGIDTSQAVEADGSAASVRVVVQDRASGAAGSVTVPLNRR